MRGNGGEELVFGHPRGDRDITLLRDGHAENLVHTTTHNDTQRHTTTHNDTPSASKQEYIPS